jgi:hypothetical protein
MSKSYYLFINDEQAGPFTIEELATHKIYNDTPIWCEDFDDWKKASEVEELQSLIVKTPPAFKKSEPPPMKPIVEMPKINLNPIKEEAKMLGEFAVSASKQTGKMILKIVIIVVSIALAIRVISLIMELDGSPDNSSISFDREKNYPLQYLRITSIGELRKRVFGSKADAKCSIENTAERTTYTNIQLKITFINRNGGVLSVNQVNANTTIPPSILKPIDLELPYYDGTEMYRIEIVSAQPE